MIEEISKKDISEKRRFWKTHIQAWGKSGLIQAEYCRQYELDVRRFMYWKKQFQTGDSSVTIVPVNIDQPLRPRRPASAPIRLVMDNRFEIAIGDDFSEKTLEKVIRTLGRV